MDPALDLLKTHKKLSSMTPLLGQRPITYVSDKLNVLEALFPPRQDQDILKLKLHLHHTIRSYRAYEDDWDAYGGKAANNSTVEHALSILNTLPENAKLPTSGLSGDGHIDLIWEFQNGFININLSGNQKFSYFARDNEGKEYFGDDQSEMPNALLEIINSIK